MAKGIIETYLNALPPDQKRVLVPALNYLQDNWRLGDDNRAQNAQWFRFSSTTNSTANDEFTVAHSLGQIPRWCIPVLALNSSGSQVVTLRTTRPADVNRVYLSSPTTNVVLDLFFEV